MSLIRSAGAQAAARIARNRLADLRFAVRSEAASDAGSLPHFIVVGTVKAGTTSLSGNLREHPRIFMPPREVKFFSDQWHKGVDWYRDVFAAGAGKVRGEKTPDYMSSHRSMKRIHQVVPEAKIMVLLRDPVARVMSEINHRIADGRLPATEEIDEAYVRRLTRDRLRGRRIFERGFYLKQIRGNVLPFFPRERVLIRVTDDRARTIDRARLRAARREGQLIGEDTSAATLELLNDICDFLEIERFTGTENFMVSGVRVHRAAATAEAKQMLHDLYAEHNARLFDFLGFEIPAWGEEVASGR